MLTMNRSSANFLADPDLDDRVQRMYAADRDGQGYVSNLTRIWAQSPESLSLVSEALALAVQLAGIDFTQRALLVSAAASALRDSYCSLAWGAKLAMTSGEEAAAGVITDDDTGLNPERRLLTAWARRMVREPNATTEAHVEELRAIGYDDRQIFAITVFVALRIAFSMVNDTLGAAPDPELLALAPAGVREAVDYGRPASGRTPW